MGLWRVLLVGDLNVNSVDVHDFYSFCCVVFMIGCVFTYYYWWLVFDAAMMFV